MAASKNTIRFRCANPKCRRWQRVTTKSKRATKSDIEKALKAVGVAAPMVVKVIKELFA